MLGLDNMRSVGWANKRNFGMKETQMGEVVWFQRQGQKHVCAFGLGVRRACRYLKSEG